MARENQDSVLILICSIQVVTVTLPDKPGLEGEKGRNSSLLSTRSNRCLMARRYNNSVRLT